MKLGFRIERQGEQQRPVKIRDDGRQGLCVGDEALLWDALVSEQEQGTALRSHCVQLEENLANVVAKLEQIESQRAAHAAQVPQARRK